MTTETPMPEGDGRVRRRTALIAGGIAVPVLVAVLLVLLIGGDEELAGGEPREISAEGLRSFAAGREAPVYWAGSRRGEKLELTVNDRGYVYVRYLPEGAPIGEAKPAYTTVASYPVEGAYERARRDRGERGRVQRTLPGRGIAVHYRGRPTSVYLAHPGTDVLVEVYDPEPHEARRLALSGRVVPVR